MFAAALFAIAADWEQPKCGTAGEWVNKLLMHAYNEIHSAIKKVILRHTTQMGLQRLQPGERSQTQRQHSCEVLETPKLKDGDE